MYVSASEHTCSGLEEDARWLVWRWMHEAGGAC